MGGSKAKMARNHLWRDFHFYIYGVGDVWIRRLTVRHSSDSGLKKNVMDGDERWARLM